MNETHHLMETRKNLERALQETEGPMRVTSECIYHREGRKGIDLVNDAPENSLMREVDTIKSCQDKMRQTLEQVRLLKMHLSGFFENPIFFKVNHQLGVNRNNRHQLERDLANKDGAIAIGKQPHSVGFYPEILPLFNLCERSELMNISQLFHSFFQTRLLT